MRARTLLRELYNEYAERLGDHSDPVSESHQSTTTDKSETTSSSVFASAVTFGAQASTTTQEANQGEIECYLSNAYPCSDSLGVFKL